MQPIRIGLAGVGAIARHQHIPAICANAAFRLDAAASLHGEIHGIPNFRTLKTLLTAVPGIDAVVICTPPQTHYELAKLALEMGKHVLLEKPPCTSLAQLDDLVRLAAAGGRTLYQAWHSQHAKGVPAAAELLRARRLRSAQVTWKEDVRIYHPRSTLDMGGWGIRRV